MRIRPPRAFAHVDLFGEITDWQSPIALRREGDTFFTAVDLPPGVYQYKLRGQDEDGTQTWFLDAHGMRTRSADGNRNSVLVVDGAPEPWLFAPGAPWVEELARGGLRVLVGVRGGADVAVAWSEGAGWSEAVVDRAFEEDEHVFFVATLPTGSARVRLRLTTGDQTFITAHERRERIPEWWPRAIGYAIDVDRFRPAIDHADWMDAPEASGHLDGIRRSLEELAGLGVDTLFLGPVHVGASAHRHDIVDPLRVDGLLGGEDAYRALVRDARLRGMRVVQDVSFSHAGRGFPAHADVLMRGRASRHAAWFLWRDDGEDLLYLGKRTDAPLLDQHHPEVQALAIATVEAFADRGVKGLRLAAGMPLDLGRKLRRRFRELVPDGVVVGEIVAAHAWRWRSANAVDAATDLAFREILGALAGNDGPPITMEDALDRLARSELLGGGDPPVHAVRFMSTREPTSASRLLPAYALLATLPGVPMLPEQGPMPWTSSTRDRAHREVVMALLQARRSSAALRSGSLQLLHVDATTLVFRRAVDTEVVDVAVSFDAEPRTIELDDDELPALTALAAIGGASTRGPSVLLPPYAALVARREHATGRALPPLVARRNLTLRDQDLVAASPSATARPSRFSFSLGDCHDPRCVRCIAHGSAARSLSSGVLDALADDLGYGDHFAFGHGVEALTAPLFWEVLDAIASARGSEPHVVHLLTDGLRLEPRVAGRLVANGVGSIAIALDAATAATADAIRPGARFHDVRENLRSVLAWRVREGADLRVGISVVVLQQNVAELDAIVDLAADLGADWVKLDEGTGATPFAKRSRLAYSAADVRVAIHRAMHRGRARGIVMVDHTRDLTVWRCRLDPSTRDFLEGDEYANRGPIHPCRSPWETACIEPDGDVRVRDFLGPRVGNVVQTPLSSLWNAPEAQALRIAVGRARLCGAGPVTCV